MLMQSHFQIQCEVWEGRHGLFCMQCQAVLTYLEADTKLLLQYQNSNLANDEPLRHVIGEPKPE